MENPKPEKGKVRRQLVLWGAALSILLIAPIGASAASLDTGHFFIQAQDADEPEFKATAGMNGKVETGNPGGPGEGNEGTGYTGTARCANESATVTQEMVDWSENNKALAAAGQAPKLWPGSDWYYIYKGSYYEASSGPNPGFELSHDLLFIFSSTPSVSASDFVALGSNQDSKGQLWDLLKGKTLVGDMNYDTFRESLGVTASVIGSYSFEYAGMQMSACSYFKFQDGKLSSADKNTPAYYGESDAPFNKTTQTLYATNGLPAFGPEKASWTVVDSTSGVIKSEFFYKPSNGERWDYAVTKNTLWHTDHAILDTRGDVRNITWTDCANDDCSVKLPNPTAERG